MTDEELIGLAGALKRRSKSGAVRALAEEVLDRLAHGTMRHEVGMTKNPEYMRRYMKDWRARKKAIAKERAKLEDVL